MSSKRRTTIGLGVAITALAALPAAAPAVERCCFRVQATATGTLLANYDAQHGPDGFRPRDSWHGSHDLTWSWTIRHLAEYRESDDRQRVPFLSLPEICSRLGRGRRCRTTAVKMRISYKEDSELCTWERPQDVTGDGRPDVQACGQPVEYPNCNPDWGFSTGGRFIDLGSNLGPTWAVDFMQFESGVRGLRAGHHVGASQLPGVTVDGAHCRSPGDHGPFTPTSDGNDFIFASSAGGPFKYELALPPPRRADFRRSNRFGTGLFPLRTDHPPEQSLDPELRRHTMAATGNVEVSFVWFPKRKLRREARKLDRMQ